MDWMKFLFAERHSLDLDRAKYRPGNGTAKVREQKPEMRRMKALPLRQQTMVITDCQLSIHSFGSELLFLIAIGMMIFPSASLRANLPFVTLQGTPCPGAKAACPGLWAQGCSPSGTDTLRLPPSQRLEQGSPEGRTAARFPCPGVPDPCADDGQDVQQKDQTYEALDLLCSNFCQQAGEFPTRSCGAGTLCPCQAADWQYTITLWGQEDGGRQLCHCPPLPPLSRCHGPPGVMDLQADFSISEIQEEGISPPLDEEVFHHFS